MRWRRRPETFRIVMEPSQSGLSLPHIVVTSRVDVQRGVAHAAMWRKTRHPYIMRGYDYCGLQASGDAHRPQPAYHSLPAQDTSDVGLYDAAPGSLLSLVERRQLFLHALALHLELGEGCLQRTSRLQHGP